MSQALKERLVKESDVTFITKLRKNIKGQHLDSVNEALLNGRSLIETMFDELQNLCQSEHYRQHNVTGFMANSLSG